MATVEINTIAGDNVLDAIEQARPLVISGTTTGISNAGSPPPDLLTNPSFEQGVTGWTAVFGAEPNTAVAGQVTIAGTSDATQGLEQVFATVPGQTYTISMDVAALSGQWFFLVEEAASETTYGNVQYLNAAGTYYYTFTATSNSARVFLANNFTGGSSITVASVSLPTSTVSVELNGTTYQSKVTDGQWSITVPPEELAALPEGALFVRANVVSSAGEAAAATNQLTVDTFAGGTIAEHAAVGSVVATLNGVDIAAGHSISLYDDAGGRFAVLGNKIVVKSEVLLDYGQAQSHTILAVISDGTNVTDKLLTINLADVVNERVTGTDASERIVGGSGADVFRGMAGNDILIGDAGNDYMDGGTGGDRLDGGSGADRLFGQAGVDVLLGRDGNDRLDGGKGADKLYGQDGNDVLLGGADNDRIDGGNGADTAVGGTGNDVLYGGSANDILTGGFGRDLMTGGAGRDRFVFDDRDTGSSRSAADYILDFRGALGDRLDLRLVDANSSRSGDQAFTFVGKADFSAAGQVRYEKTGADTWIYLNTDRDLAAEAVIRLKGAMDFVEGCILR